MKKHKFAVVIVLVTSLIFTKEVFASYNIFYVYYDKNMLERWQRDTVLFENEMSLSKEIEVVFNIFFESEKNVFIPKGVKVIDALVIDNTLILNVSNHINNYAGTFYETALKKQLVRTALDINGIDKVTLLIDNKFMVLPEGLEIKEELKWQGSMDESVIN